MQAMTRSLMSEDSNSAIAQTIVNIARPMGLSLSHLILDAGEAHAEMVDFLERHAITATSQPTSSAQPAQSTKLAPLS
jgi:hypothetical protein